MSRGEIGVACMAWNWRSQSRPPMTGKVASTAADCMTARRGGRAQGTGDSSTRRGQPRRSDRRSRPARFPHCRQEQERAEERGEDRRAIRATTNGFERALPRALRAEQAGTDVHRAAIAALAAVEVVLIAGLTEGEVWDKGADFRCCWSCFSQMNPPSGLLLLVWPGCAARHHLSPGEANAYALWNSVRGTSTRFGLAVQKANGVGRGRTSPRQAA